MKPLFSSKYCSQQTFLPLFILIRLPLSLQPYLVAAKLAPKHDSSLHIFSHYLVPTQDANLGFWIASIKPVIAYSHFFQREKLVAGIRESSVNSREFSQVNSNDQTMNTLLYHFRERVVGNDAVQKVFDTITDKIIKTLRLPLGKQRLDLTPIRSNMANLSRLQLFVRTTEGFLKRLKKDYPEKLETISEDIHKRYLEREGYFADSRSSDAKSRLSDCAKPRHWLIDLVFYDEEVAELDSYNNLKRLFTEQCELKGDDEGNAGGGGDRIILREEAPSTSLLNLSDPDATYGPDGKRYKTQISETCDKDNEIQVITNVEVQRGPMRVIRPPPPHLNL